MPDGYANYGERIGYIGCTIYNNTLGLRGGNADGTFHLTVCSLDYNTQQVTVDKGRIILTDCHIESNSYSSSPFVIANNDGAYLQIKGGWVLCTANSTVVPTFSIGASGTAQLLDAFVTGLGPTSTWATGTGQFNTRNLSSYNISNNPLLLRSQDSILIDGGFEGGSVFDAFITGDTSAITSRTSGANINLTTDAAQARSGSKSLKAAKSFGPGSLAVFCIGAPILDRKSKSTFKGYYKKPGSETGDMILSRQFARVEIINGQPVVTRVQSLGDLTVTFTSSAVDWTAFQTSEPLTATPTWANYTLMSVNLTGFIGPGSVHFDDFEFFEF